MIHITTALACEARPLIEHYNLKTIMTSDVFKIYASDDVRLIITGIGKISAAAATSYLHAYFSCKKNNVWLNIGIAGHPVLDVGTGVLAHKITDNNSGRSWYPPRIIDAAYPTQDLISVDLPENTFNEMALFDMEASGFYATACRFATSELVQCYKVVSDNRIFCADKISKANTSTLIKCNLKAIDRLISHLRQLGSEISGTEDITQQLDNYIKRWHFTHYQRNQLGQLLRKLKTLDTDISDDNMTRLRSGREVISYLKQRLHQHS